MICDPTRGASFEDPMGQISDAKLQMVRGLIELAPDSAIRSLLAALGSDRRLDPSLSRVRSLVEAEADDRRARNLVFAPIAPLCAPPGPFRGLVFPPRTLALLWKALKQAAPGATGDAKDLADDWRASVDSPERFDSLCARAAFGLRNGEPAFAPAIEAADAGAGREALAACLDIAAVTRGAITQLPEWLGRMTGEKIAKLRLAYRDAGAVSADAGPRFFEMLAAQLNEPWLILRVISGVMDRPNEAYISSSELSGFGDRVLADIDREIAEINGFAPARGRAAAHAAAHAVHNATVEITEFEQSIGLLPNGPWGKRIAGQKRTMAATIEAHLNATDDAVSHALPLQTKRTGPRATRSVPRLTQDPDPASVETAAALLTFLSEVRPSAAAGGFAAARTRVAEAMQHRLDAYVEDLLEDIRAGDGHDATRARAFLDIAAEFCGLAQDEQAAQIVRRRGAAA